MDGEKLIQVSFQIPPSALDSLSRLTEQLRLLTQAAAAPSAPVSRTSEYVESGSFDPERFYELQRDMSEPRAVRRTVPDIADAPSASSVISQVRNAEAASADIQREPEDARSAGDGSLPAQLAQTPAPDSGARYTEERDGPLLPAGEPRREIRDLDLSAVREEAGREIETPMGAGIAVETQPEIPRSRRSGTIEELADSGEAPLTAQAVSMAFERDGRRYDNGFPLY